MTTDNDVYRDRERAALAVAKVICQEDIPCQMCRYRGWAIVEAANAK